MRDVQDVEGLREEVANLNDELVATKDHIDDLEFVTQLVEISAKTHEVERKARRIESELSVLGNNELAEFRD